jgi:hypothetical protein
MIGRGEIDLHAGGLFDLFVAVELTAVIRVDGLEEAWVRLDQFDHALIEGSDFSVVELAVTTAMLVPPHMQIDGLVTDLEYVEKSKPSANLLRTELVAKKRIDQGPLLIVELAVSTGGKSSGVRVFLGLAPPGRAVVS